MVSRPRKSAFLFGTFQICGPVAHRELAQGVEHLQFQPSPGGEGAEDQPGVPQPLPESFHRAAIGVTQLGRAGRVLQQEDQPGHALDAGGPEFQLGVGDLLTSHQRAILESDHGHVDLAFTDPLLAVIGRATVPRGKVPHIDRGHPGPAHRV